MYQLMFDVFVNTIVLCLSFYINYKLMKKKVNQYTRQIEVSEHNREYVLKDFSRVLDSQVKKSYHVRFLLTRKRSIIKS